MEVVHYPKIKLEKSQKADMTALMSSWRTVYAAIKDMPDSVENLDKLAEMLAWESQNPAGPRKHLLDRLHMKINSMRQRMEYVNLLKVAKR